MRFQEFFLRAGILPSIENPESGSDGFRMNKFGIDADDFPAGETVADAVFLESTIQFIYGAIYVSYADQTGPIK